MDNFDYGFGGPRLPLSGIRPAHAMVAGTHGDLLDSVPLPVVVLNSYWQIVFANRDFLDLFPASVADGLLGQRLGEALGCSNSGTSVSGCGTSTGCRECGLGATLYRAPSSDTGAEARPVRTGGGSALERAELAWRFFCLDDDMMRLCTFVNVAMK